MLSACCILSDENFMWIRLLRSTFWSGNTISLRNDASVIRGNGHSGCSSISEQVIARVREAFVCSPRSIYHETKWYHPRLYEMMEQWLPMCKTIPEKLHCIYISNQGVNFCADPVFVQDCFLLFYTLLKRRRVEESCNKTAEMLKIRSRHIMTNSFSFKMVC